MIQVYYPIRGELLIIMTDVILNSILKVYYKNYTTHRRQVYACGSTDVSDKLSQSKTLQSTTSCRLTTGSIIYFYWRLKKVIQEFKTGRTKANKKYVLDKDRHTQVLQELITMCLKTAVHIRIPAMCLSCVLNTVMWGAEKFVSITS